MDAPTPAPDVNAVVAHTDDAGRTLSGVGTTPEALAETMDRHAPEPVPETPGTPATTEKPTRGRQRFAELTRKAMDAEAKAAALEQQLRTYQAPGAVTPPVPPTPATLPPSPSGPERGGSGRSQPTEDEVGTKYKTYADFVVDSARWVTEQQQPLDIDTRVRQGIEADRANRDFLAKVESTWAKGRAVYPDFDALRMNGPGAQVPMASEKIQAIIAHPASEHMQVVIAKDALLAQRLANMSPMEFGMAMATFAPSAGAVTPASTAAGGTITPPAPIQPVGSGSPTTAVSSSDLAHRGDYAAYKARREEERRRARR